MDFHRAFDSVWKEGLLAKLLRLGIGGHFYDIIKNMYTLTTCHIKLPDGITDGFRTEIGIKQGNALALCSFVSL